MERPKIIALCGNPKSGKSEIQKILRSSFGFESIDDGMPMRDFAIRHLGATIEDVTTQEGKAKRVKLPGGKEMTWREFLGEFGNRIEDLLGPDAIPEIAARNLLPGGYYAVGSVRRNQGRVWKEHGALVIEVSNKYAPPSPHAFDAYDGSIVDLRIDNDVDASNLSPERLKVAQRSLQDAVHFVVIKHFGLKPFEWLNK